MKLLNTYLKGCSIRLSQDMIYKWNFLIKVFATMVQDFIGPLIILLIYTSTSGIPGWSLYEFILFQGTLTLVFGFGHTFFITIPVEVIKNVRRGTFDRFLLMPLGTMRYLTSIAMDWDGFGQIGAGLVLMTIAVLNLEISFGWNVLAFLFLLFLAFLFQYALMILVAASTFLFVQSWALLDLLFKLTDMARYPANVYSASMRYFLTFVFPIAISAFYPVDVLLRGFSIATLFKVSIPVILFFIVSVVIWKRAMRSYTSAGG